VNVEHFAAELSGLFDDFPRSEHPSGRRFDDVSAAVPNLAMENNLALVNLAASLLGPGESYVEAGTYMGASLIAAARGNEGKDLVAIDNFRFGPMEVAGRSLPAASQAALEANLDRFGVGGATILEGDALELLRGDALQGRSVGVFYYDACHDYEPQLEALRLVEPYLAEPALVIVDDSDWPQVQGAVRDYVAGQPRARLLVEIAGSTLGQPQWWEGMQVLAWSGSGQSSPGGRR
jgi:predicted O-methyltransferase YrrM